MTKRILICFCLLLSTIMVMAQKIKTVEATYTYYAPENVTVEQARRTALERAMIQAIADEFGTIISQSNVTRLEDRNGKSSEKFISIGGSDVRGEWIETIGEPTYQISYEGNMLVVICQVKGKAREIVSAEIDLKVHVLRNGTEDKYESSEFRSGDDLYLSFQSPIDGYLAVYLVDAEGKAFCLLPYQHQTNGIYPISANQHYVFFDPKTASAAERTLVDEYIMTCEQSSEYNQLYVIFSPNTFAKAVDSSGGINTYGDQLPRELSFDDFNKWLVKCRKKDKDMNAKMIPITITQ